MRGRAEHQGNRNYFGVEGIAAARQSPIRERLARIASLRTRTPALQRGVQVDLEFKGDRASFYRVYQQGDRHQIALVLLNKGDAPAEFAVSDYLEAGTWRDGLGGRSIEVAANGTLRATVAAHDVAVYVLGAQVRRADLSERLARQMTRTPRTTGG
jgi:cyclomaltodextrin glucanotransferase